MSLRTYLIKRVLYTVVLIVFVILLNWVIFEAMPGVSGNLYQYLGQQRIPPNEYQHQLQIYGLDKPYWVRFYDYIQAMFTFNFGYSYASGLPVAYEMIHAGYLQNTLLLLGTSTVLAIVIGTLLGIVISRKRGSSSDSFWVTSSLTTFSLPSFFVGILLIFVFAVALGWFPSEGTHPTTWDNTVYIVHPSLLDLLVQGVTSNRELAERLVVTENTVKYHLRNILDMKRRHEKELERLKSAPASPLPPTTAVTSH